MSRLKDFSDLITQMSEKSARKEHERIQQLSAALPSMIAALVRATNEELVELLLANTLFRSNPLENEIRHEYEKHIKAEIFNRMEK